MKHWTQRVHDSLALGSAGVLVSLGVHEDNLAYLVLGGVVAVLSFASLFVKDPEPDRPHWRRKLPARAEAYRDLLERGERELLTHEETAKIGAWLRDQRVTAELSSEDTPELFEDMAEVLLELHKRSILPSADPLWGRIDTVVDRLREQRA